MFLKSSTLKRSALVMSVALVLARSLGVASADTSTDASGGTSEKTTNATVNTSTGAAQQQYPFELPPARGEVKPSLALTYSSQAGEGEAGMGWSLGIPRITRRRNDLAGYRPLRNGDLTRPYSFPQLTAAAADTDPIGGALLTEELDRFDWQGQELELICEFATPGCAGAADETFSPDVAGAAYYRLKRETTFARFFLRGPSRDNGTTWTVQYPSGRTEVYGGGDAYESAPVRENSAAVRWNLSKVYDANGNQAVYQWRHHGITLGDAVSPTGDTLGAAVLSDVYYNSNLQTSPADLEGYEHHVELHWEKKPGVVQMYAPIWRSPLDLRLHSVTVTSKQWGQPNKPRVQTRRYNLSYLDGEHAHYDKTQDRPLLGKSFLGRIQMEGASAAEEASVGNVDIPRFVTPHSPEGTRWPATTFEYTEPVSAVGGVGVPFASPYIQISNLYSLYTLTTSDLNRDGWTDIMSGSQYLFHNTTTGWAGPSAWRRGCTAGTGAPDMLGGAPWPWNSTNKSLTARVFSPNVPGNSFSWMTGTSTFWFDSPRSGNPRPPFSGWRLATLSPTTTAEGCWTWGTDIPDEPLPGPHPQSHRDGIFQIGDVDGDGLPDGYVRSWESSEWNNFGGSYPAAAPVGKIRFSRKADPGRADLGAWRFSERVTTNLTFEGLYCVSSGDCFAYDADDVTRKKLTEEDTNYSDVRLHALVDMNGDGLADALGSTRITSLEGEATGSYRLAYFPGNGKGTFGCDLSRHAGAQTADGGNCQADIGKRFGAAGYGGVEIELQNRTGDDTKSPTLIDFNGDGLMDIVIPRVKSYEYNDGDSVLDRMYFGIWLNSGGRVFRRFCPEDRTGATCHGETDPFITPYWGDSPEQVERFGVNQILPADINGDGIDELVVVEVKGLTPVGLLAPTRPGLLSKVDNGIGGVVEYTYDSYQRQIRGTADDTPENQLEAITHVVRSQTVSNGLAGPAGKRHSQTLYTFRKPAFDTWTRSLVGFGEVTVNEVGGQSIRTTTHFTPCQSAGGCADTARVSETDPDTLSAGGLTASVEVLSGDPSTGPVHPLTQTVFEYKSRLLSSGRRWRTEVSAKTIYHFDTSVGATMTAPSRPLVWGVERMISARIPKWESEVVQAVREEFVEDAVGNITETRDLGRVDLIGLTSTEPSVLVRRDLYYLHSPGRWIWRKWANETTDQPQSSSRVHLMGYDPNGNLKFEKSVLTGTRLLQRSHQDGAEVALDPDDASVDGEILTKYIVYGPGGLVASTMGPFTGPAAAPTGGPCERFTYAPEYGHLLTQREIGLRSVIGTELCVGAEHGQWETSSFEYHPGFGVPTRETSALGAVTLRSYDEFGRPTKVFGPDGDTGLPIQRLASFEYAWIPSGSSIHEVDTSGERVKYFDGLGNAVVTLRQNVQGKSGAGPLLNWVAEGAAEFDSAGRKIAAFSPYTHPGPASLDLNYLGAVGARRTSYIYDTFGRELASYEGAYPSGKVLGRTEYAPLRRTVYDAEGALVGGQHYGDHVTEYMDGRERVIAVDSVHGPTVVHKLLTLAPTGEPLMEMVYDDAGTKSVTRIREYDSLGRMVAQHEPNVRVSKALLYAYDNAGRLVGTSDARGCGQNFKFDVLGRPLWTDDSPCLSSQPPHTAPLPNGDGTESFATYDEASEGADGNLGFPALGKRTSLRDTGSLSRVAQDLAGHVRLVTRQLVRPGAPSAVLANRYAPHVFRKATEYDGLGRILVDETGADVPELLNGGRSYVGLSWQKGLLYGVQYHGAGARPGDALVDDIKRRSDGLIEAALLGDAAATKVAYEYETNARTRVKRMLVQHTVAPVRPPGYLAPAPLEPTQQGTLVDTRFDSYDEMGHPTAISSGLVASEWPVGAKPMNLALGYDEQYRVNSATYATGADYRVSPFAADDDVAARAAPPAYRPKRTLWQAFEYDVRGNITASSSNEYTANYDLVLGDFGELTYGDSNFGPDQLKTARGIQIKYDQSGNMVDLLVERPGPCDNARPCNQRYVYDWDASGTLARARRYDFVGSPPLSDRFPNDIQRPADRDLRYAYSEGARVLSTATSDDGVVHTLDVFPSLRVERTTFEDGDYVRTKDNESVYLGKIARVSHASAGLPDAPSADSFRLYYTIGDVLGSASVVVDGATGELVEKVTFDVNGNTESDYRPARWHAHREDRRLTGKVEDVEVGLTYFGARYLSTNLRRWISPDPLTIHKGGGDPNPYAYVAGQMLNAIDPIGFDDLGASTTQSQMAAYAHAFVVGLGHIAGQASGNGTTPGYIPGVVDLGAISATAWNRLVDENVRPTWKTIPGDGAWAWGSQVAKGVESGYAAAREALHVNVIERGNKTVSNEVGGELASAITVAATEGASELGSLATELRAARSATAAAAEAGAGGGSGGTLRGFHGTVGDNVLGIIDSGGFVPKNGEVFLSEVAGDTFVHGADLSRRAAFSIDVAVGPLDGSVSRLAVPGNPQSILIRSPSLVPAEVLRLHVRTVGAGGFQFQTVEGVDAIRAFLGGP